MATCRILSPGKQRNPMNAAMMLAQAANRDEWFVQANRWRFQNAQANPDCSDSAHHGNSLSRKPEPGDRRNSTRRNRTATGDCGSSTRRGRQVAYENIEAQTQPLECITSQLPLLRLPQLQLPLLPWGLLIRSDLAPPTCRKNRAKENLGEAPPLWRSGDGGASAHGGLWYLPPNGEQSMRQASS
jgi:hypothetical protein